MSFMKLLLEVQTFILSAADNSFETLNAGLDQIRTALNQVSKHNPTIIKLR